MGGTCSDFELYDETQGQTNENFVGDESEKDNLELIFHSQNLSSEWDGDSESDVEQEERPQNCVAYTSNIWCVRSSRRTVLSLWYFVKLITESWTTLVFIGWWILLFASNKHWWFATFQEYKWSVLANIGENTKLMWQDTLYYWSFFGQSKPSYLNDYLRKFVDEYKELNENGFDINGKHFNVQLDSVICDAPARAFVKCIKGHSGYSGCDKCTQCGVYVGKD